MPPCSCFLGVSAATAFVRRFAEHTHGDLSGVDIVLLALKNLGAQRSGIWLSVLWELSAFWEYKGVCFDRGAIQVALKLLAERESIPPDNFAMVELAAATTIQNLSEHVFNNGTLILLESFPLLANHAYMAHRSRNKSKSS